jgi:hypothetical protein
VSTKPGAGQNADGEYRAFPADPMLATFDRSDRVYVTLALVAPEKPRILNAVDSDYVAHKAALERVGVIVHELCPDCVRKPREAQR